MSSWVKRGSGSNKALLVSVIDFYPGVNLSRRPGPHKDAKRLHKILFKLGFQVDIRTDLPAEEIYQVFKEASEDSVDDCFLGLISSHGEEGVVFGADGVAVRLAKIFSWFDGPAMAGKTKLFFIQACRGDELDSGVQVETDSVGSKDDSFSHYLSIPVDTAVMFAASAGYSAFMHPLGSVFIQMLCHLLEEEGGQELEITRLLTRLNHRVAYNFQARGKKLAGMKAMPCLITRLTREVFPFTTAGEQAFRRPRKRSGQLM